MSDKILEEIFNGGPTIVLNEEQAEAHRQLVAYMNQRGRPEEMLLLKGFAGTGKTTTISKAVEAVDHSIKIAVSAPTHKAVRVLRKVSTMGSRVTYATIHSLLGVKPVINNHTGKQEFKVSKDPEDGRIHEYDVLILDEVSMLNAELFHAVKEKFEEDGLRVVFLGDAAQIPPVKEIDSIPLMEPAKHGVRVLALEKIMRQAGDNPILDLATAIRNTYKTKTVDVSAFGAKHGGMGVELYVPHQTKEINQILEDRFCSPNFKADPDYMKVIGWTNAVVDAINQKVRKLLFEVPEGMLSLPLIMNGEKLIMDDAYSIRDQFNTVINNNEEIEVVNSSTVYKAFRYIESVTPFGPSWKEANLKCYLATIQFMTVNNKLFKGNIYICHETEQSKLAGILAHIAKTALKADFAERNKIWQNKYDIEGMFAKVKYNYAVTAHKAQGSSYDHCMVINWDILKNRNVEERNRIQYVAVTRAKKLLYIVQ